MAVAGEFNVDGLPDIAVAVAQVQLGSRTVLSVLLGNGDGALQRPETTDIERGARYLAVADLNGDGLEDVATADYFFPWSSVSVLLNDGDSGGAAPGGEGATGLFRRLATPAVNAATSAAATPRDVVDVDRFFAAYRAEDPAPVVVRKRQAMSETSLSLEEDLLCRSAPVPPGLCPLSPASRGEGEG